MILPLFNIFFVIFNLDFPKFQEIKNLTKLVEHKAIESNRTTYGKHKFIGPIWIWLGCFDWGELPALLSTLQGIGWLSRCVWNATEYTNQRSTGTYLHKNSHRFAISAAVWYPVDTWLFVTASDLKFQTVGNAFPYHFTSTLISLPFSWYKIYWNWRWIRFI